MPPLVALGGAWPQGSGLLVSSWPMDEHGEPLPLPSGLFPVEPSPHAAYQAIAEEQRRGYLKRCAYLSLLHIGSERASGSAFQVICERDSFEPTKGTSSYFMGCCPKHCRLYQAPWRPGQMPVFQEEGRHEGEMKIRISPASPPREEPFQEWLLRIETEICEIIGPAQFESCGGAGGVEEGDRHGIVFVFDIPELLPHMERELTGLGYSYCLGDSKIWRGFEVLLPPEPPAE